MDSEIPTTMNLGFSICSHIEIFNNVLIGDYLVKDWDGSIDYANNEDCEADYCNTWRRADDSGNCVAIICFHFSECIGASLNVLDPFYQSRIKYNCEPIDSGGTVPGDDYDF